MKSMKVLLGAVLAAALLLTSSACGSSGGASADGKIVVQVLPNTSVAPLYLGMSKEFFSSRGLEIEVQFAQGGSATVPAVLSGDVQFGFSSMMPLLTASSKGLPIELAMANNYDGKSTKSDYCPVIVGPDSEIEGIADLRNKTVAVNTVQNTGDLTIRRLVDRKGLKSDSVKFVELPFSNVESALQTGRVDAAWVCEPFLTMNLKAGNVVAVNNLVDLSPNFLLAGWFTSKKFASSNAEAVTAFREAMRESIDYANAHPDEARAIVPTYSDIPRDTVDAMKLPVWRSDIDRESLEMQLDLLHEYDVIKDDVDLDSLISKDSP